MKKQENMLLTGYTKEVFRPECNPSFLSLHCVAHLNDDVGEALPYLNAILGGTLYFTDPPEVMFHHQGRIIKVGAREIAVNALRDEEEADRILKWMKSEINQAWQDRAHITPCYAGRTRPKLLEILLLLPKTNCRKCGQPSCMAFAALLAEEGRGLQHCPDLSEPAKCWLAEYAVGKGPYFSQMLD